MIPARRWLRQEDLQKSEVSLGYIHSEFKASLDSTARPCLKNKTEQTKPKKTKQNKSREQTALLIAKEGHRERRGDWVPKTSFQATPQSPKILPLGPAS